MLRNADFQKNWVHCFIDCLCEIIIGLGNNIRQSTGTEQKQTRTETKKGLFGHPLAFYGTNDKTDAGIMHAHMIIFASLTPALLHHAIFDKALRNEIQTILEKYNCKMVAQLTINEHRTVSQTFIKYIIEDGETA